MWNYFISPSFKANTGVGQDSTLFPILFTLYITSLFQIFKKRTKNLFISISISILSFIDNSLFISQEKSYEKSNAVLYCSYNIISSLFNQFGLTIKYEKSEVFHFSRIIKKTKYPLLDLRLTNRAILKPKDI